MSYLVPKPAKMNCSVCRKLRKSNTFGQKFNNTFGVTFGAFVCDGCAALLYMMFVQVTDELRAGPDATQKEKIAVLVYRMQNGGRYPPPGPPTPEVMVDRLLTGLHIETKDEEA